MAFDAIETPYGKTGKIVGGSASFIALAAAKQYKKLGLVAVVGEDFDMDFLKKLKEQGTDVSGVQIKEGEKSFFWSGKYHLDMNSRDTLVTELNVLGDFDPIIPEHLTEPEFVMLGNLAPAVQITTLKRLKKKPKLTVLDTMNFWMDIAMDDLKEVLTMVDVLTINDEEARQLSGEYSLVKAAEKIRNMGPQTLIIKKGEHGALLFGKKDEIFFCPALPLEEVFDPTGAGDSFAGGFLGYMAAHNANDFETMKKAIVFGSATASFCVEKFGTERIAEITQEDLNQRVQKFVALSAVNL